MGNPSLKILVTGATGFIGARVAEALLAGGNHTVVFTGRRPPKQTSLVDRGATFVVGDLSDPAAARRAAEGTQAIIHCAGLAGTWGSYQSFYDANVGVTRNLLHAAMASGARRFINLSSPSIYVAFKNQFNLKESDRPKRFSNAYAETKWQAEQLVHAAHGEKLLTVSLRPRSVIGAGDQNVLPRLIRLKETGNLVQVGRGDAQVDVTTVGNLVDAIILCLEAPASAMGETYNVTNGVPIRLWDFVETVLKRAGLSTERRKVPYWPVMTIARMNEFYSRLVGKKEEPALLPIPVAAISFSMTLDISKAKEKLGYKPRLTTADGIEEFFKTWPRR